MTDDALAALQDLDARVAARGLDLWIGAEPTFTRRQSDAPWWLWQAEAPGADGYDKPARARALADALAAGRGAVAEVEGRHYPDEARPRFCLRVRWPRDPADGPGELTVTPDPGVVEVNAAPCRSGAALLRHLRAVYAAAADAGLSPVRYRYNGDVVDSGGGGQLTLGGSSPEASPAFLHPALLPRLVRYLEAHPSLSYWFLGECAGSASQAPRPDEGVAERHGELQLACALLERAADDGASSAALLGATLGPLLVDASGNAHRAELNVEKLWNPALGARGTLGLVELRALQMPHTAEQLAAAGALLRAVAARCTVAPVPPLPAPWGARLHDEWALPGRLRADLDDVLADLAAHGLALPPPLPALAASYRAGPLLDAEVMPGVRLAVRRAVEFWPLLGDVASQERATSRQVDASCERLELIVVAAGDAPPPELRWHGRPLPLRPAPWLAAGARALAVRRRVFAPTRGLHPSLPAQDPLALELHAGAAAVAVTLHGWRADGGPYPGLPDDADDAAARRAARLVVSAVPPAPPSGPPLSAAGWTVDLRAAQLAAAAPAVPPPSIDRTALSTNTKDAP